MNKSWTMNALSSHRLQSFICISLSASMLYRIYYVPKLTTDDWAQLVAYNIFNTNPWFSWPSHRPLHWMPFRVVYTLFGLNPHLFHAVNLVIYIGIFFLIFLLLERLLPDQYPFALVGALLAMVYPADFTMSWINMISLRLAWLLGLVGMWLLIDYASHGRGVRAILSAVIMLISLFIYEGALGVLIAWMFLLAIICWRLERKRWLGLFAPLATIIPYIWLRLYYLPKLQKGGPNLEMFNQLTTAELLHRLGGISVLIRAWSQPFRAWLRGADLPGLTNGLLVLGILLVMVIFALGALLLMRALWTNFSTPMAANVHKQTVKRYGWTGIFAAGFILAGYFPIIFIYAPNLEETVTRANMYAIPAAAALIVALASLAILAMTHYKRQWQALLWAMILPLMLVGIGVRINVQKSGMEAWVKQEVIWQKLFELAPDLKDDTAVVFILKGRSETVYGHLPIYAEWEADSALQTFYQNPTLSGLIYSPEMYLYSEAVIKPIGVVRFVDKKVIPYDQTVFVVYDVRSGRLRILEKIANHPEYNPWNRIVKDPDKSWRYRYLVGVD